MSSASFRGEIVVASRIVDYLSSGLYKSPAACLKELINNSYDADATRVNLFVKPDADRIIIEDDGLGMDRNEFEKHFRRISESRKRDDSQTTPRGSFHLTYLMRGSESFTSSSFSTRLGLAQTLIRTISAEISAGKWRTGASVDPAASETHTVDGKDSEDYPRVFIELGAHRRCPKD